MPQSKRVLDKDAFDALHLSTIVNRGIGAGPVWDWQAPRDGAGSLCPNCLYGHAMAVTDSPSLFRNAVSQALVDAGILTSTSDNAVHAINERKNRDRNARVSWREYTKETGLTRGE